jgi:methylated-DNA-protein-cysteine methyltransferase related protein
MQSKTASFYQKVYAVVRKIPTGRVCSYGDIAEYLGAASSARLVGFAMNNAHSERLQVPAHRVVNRIGLLTGKHHFGSATMMQQLLENEGIKVKNDQVQDFEKRRWVPLKELNRKKKKSY